MSDRRPSNPRPLFVGCPTHPEHADRKHDYMGNLSNYGDPCSFQIEPATVDEALAAVRRGVESGTIKGEVRKVEDSGRRDYFVPVIYMPDARYGEQFLVIPVSDGGSET